MDFNADGLPAGSSISAFLAGSMRVARPPLKKDLSINGGRQILMAWSIEISYVDRYNLNPQSEPCSSSGESLMPLLMDDHAIQNSFDTTRYKSPWIFFGILPFFVLSATGAILVGSSIMKHGFRDPWQNQAIGLTLLIVLSSCLGYALSLGLSRFTLTVVGASLHVRKSSVFGSFERTIYQHEIRAFHWCGSDVLFWVDLETVVGERFPVLQSVATKRFDEARRLLSSLAPFISFSEVNQRASGDGVSPN